MSTNAKIGFGSVIFLLGGITFMMTTNPQKLPAVLLIVPFIFFFVALFLAIAAISTVMAGQDKPLFRRKNFLFALVLSGYPIMLLLLQSIGQLSAVDTLVLTLLLALSCFYIARSNFAAKV